MLSKKIPNRGKGGLPYSHLIVFSVQNHNNKVDAINFRYNSNDDHDNQVNAGWSTMWRRRCLTGLAESGVENAGLTKKKFDYRDQKYNYTNIIFLIFGRVWG